jgi:hypothetical protein
MNRKYIIKLTFFKIIILILIKIILIREKRIIRINNIYIF